VLDAGAALPAHALLETYSVLTGFPPPHRAAPDVVETWLDDRFPDVFQPPPVPEQRELVHTLSSAGRIGGAVYDALVALTATVAGATLVTADRRALGSTSSSVRRHGCSEPNRSRPAEGTAWLPLCARSHSA
jgi:hypothetical protein